MSAGYWTRVSIISIHALTRSATNNSESYFLPVPISIHALTRSATKQPTKADLAKQISIHALTRSATRNSPAFH